jgi:IPT/TIG domain
MTHTPARSPHSAPGVEAKSVRRGILIGLAFLAAAALLVLSVAPLFAQNEPHIATVDPASGKVSDTITVTGENLGKGHVSAVFLSDKKTDYKATVVEQSADKIVMKVPQVAPGDYNVSVQTGNTIFIQPVRFTVE